MENTKLSTRLESLTTISYRIFKIILSALFGLITSKADLGIAFSPFSLSLLSVSPLTSLSPISVYFGALLGFITKEFSIYNFKYICLNTIVTALIYIFGKSNYVKMFYSPIIPSIVCATGGSLFVIIEDLTLFNVMLLLCESILCGCIAYFCKYFYDAIRRGTRFDTKDIIAFNIAVIMFISAINEYYIYGISLSLVFSIIIIYLSSYYLQRIIALSVTFCISAIMAVLHFEIDNYFILLYIPSLISILTTKFNKKYCVASFYIPYLSAVTLNGLSIFNMNLIVSPLISAVIYYLIPREKLINYLSKYIKVFEPKEISASDVDTNRISNDYCEITSRFLSNINETKIMPIIDKSIENRMKKQLFFWGCRNIQINNYYNNLGYQTVTVNFKSQNEISAESIKYKLNRLCDKTFTLSDKTFENGIYTYKYELTTKYQVECFALYKAKEGETVCGDSVSAFKSPENNYVMILADGMGSGKNAYCKSNDAVTMLKKMLISRVSPENALNTINASLCISKDEIGFSTVDLCTISLDSGEMELYKCGAYISMILRDKKLSVIESGGMPAGLSDKLMISKHVFSLNNNDLLILLSDGLSYAFEQIQALLLLNDYGNLKAYAKAILDCACEFTPNECDDDMTVFIAKITKRNLE